MATRTTPPPVESIDYREAEGFDAAHSPDGPQPPDGLDALAPPAGDRSAWREWMMIATGLVGLVAILSVIVSVFAFASGSTSHETTTVVKREAPAASGAPAKAPTLADAKGVAFERFSKVDPTRRRSRPAA